MNKIKKKLIFILFVFTSVYLITNSYYDDDEDESELNKEDQSKHYTTKSSELRTKDIETVVNSKSENEDENEELEMDKINKKYDDEDIDLEVDKIFKMRKKLMMDTCAKYNIEPVDYFGTKNN